MARYGMLIDLTKCAGCMACTVSCQLQNDLPPEVHFIKFYQQEYGTFPVVSLVNIPVQCQHCEKPPCVYNCPTGASYIADGGVVLLNESKCIGCKYCMTSCPYNARVLNEETHTPMKCIFCFDHVKEGEQPMCVQTCLGEARVFGDLDDPESELNKQINEKKARPLRPDLGTKPKIFYVW
ncbi:4Fe-4S dicluster domain-containing protein [Hydrogenibacillus schlegelii]|uniref:4Fe-4S ferredoxin n=1 Tax=Hydrogenibacillus schlegelii TaxID=1484 RepID=A0A132MHF1_HYDSH|nr:4Fe-4S dicluster domain-containing protein [Hydrogenibacillus schlegelii]KWW97290.1 4Fe-4S ferredoxin [Hydrogenibacillus schlegelii]OAR05563.1 4Fe-4S ferredoxin [Hydrogenibacillus schlegelii]